MTRAHAHRSNSYGKLAYALTIVDALADSPVFTQLAVKNSIVKLTMSMTLLFGDEFFRRDLMKITFKLCRKQPLKPCSKVHQKTLSASLILPMPIEN
jgi:hypothetical protein